MSDTRRAAAAAAGDPDVMRAVEQYVAERLTAEAKLITASMDTRRFGGPPTDCDGEYEVLERWK